MNKWHTVNNNNMRMIQEIMLGKIPIMILRKKHQFEYY